MNMKDLMKRIFKRSNKMKNLDSRAGNSRANEINETTNAVFSKYEKCFKDLARYDREGKAPVN